MNRPLRLLSCLISTFTLGLPATLSLAAAPAAEQGGSQLPKLSANWIWKSQAGPVYNQTVIARKSFTLDKPGRGTLRITADSSYRLTVNGRWVADGPCRAWPEHYQYDVIDVSDCLREGNNELEVVARYYGVGDFHKLPQRPGLLVQLDVVLGAGEWKTIVSDTSWQMAEAAAWVANTPKVSVQMEPLEIYDARRAKPFAGEPAQVVSSIGQGPWKGLEPRDVAMLTRRPVEFKSFGGAKIVRSPGLNFCLPAVRLMHPGLIEANHNTSAPCGMATVLQTEKGCTLNVQLEGMKLAIDGRAVKPGQAKLDPGKHLLLAFVATVVGHDKEKAVRFLDADGFQLVNPLDSGASNPWCFVPLEEYKFADTDLVWMAFSRESPHAETVKRYHAQADRLLREIRSPQEFAAKLASRAKSLAHDAMFVEDCFWQFTNRRVVGEAAAPVRDPGAAIEPGPAATVIQPSPQGDVELLYDLGEQNCGYWKFELTATAGTVVDLFAVEYIAPDGRIQFSHGNRNGLRYVTREGLNEFTSLKRRSGRYLFLTLRNQKGPVELRHLGLVESTYPVQTRGSFACSDPRLDRIWEISNRTLKLCMEDTYTDCPLYEQTHWVGDARNESLFAYSVFGAEDLARHCIRVTAQSLDRYPITGCQTPSCWDVLIPAWSFLWGISTWDYYWQTGDREFLREIYPAVIRNLRGAEKFVNPQGLYASPSWNFFDWTPIDANQKAVLHNSMLLVGAIDAALKEAAVLGETRHVEWLKALRARLVQGVNRLWDTAKKAYPDSIHDDGSVSPSTSQHTSFLAILYDIVERVNLPHARQNLLAPPEKMVRIGSPFAALYLYEALEKLGLEDRIVAEIYRNYLPMLEAGATTVWESFPSGTTGSGGFPTRSHCHAWSSAPSLYLGRVVLGVRLAAAGAAKIEISPHLAGLKWARGTMATVRGPVSVSWRLVDPQTLEVTCESPKNIEVRFVRNDSHQNKKVLFNGAEQPAP